MSMAGDTVQRVPSWGCSLNFFLLLYDAAKRDISPIPIKWGEHICTVVSLSLQFTWRLFWHCQGPIITCFDIQVCQIALI